MAVAAFAIPAATAAPAKAPVTNAQVVYVTAQIKSAERTETKYTPQIAKVLAVCPKLATAPALARQQAAGAISVPYRAAKSLRTRVKTLLAQMGLRALAWDLPPAEGKQFTLHLHRLITEQKNGIIDDENGLETLTEIGKAHCAAARLAYRRTAGFLQTHAQEEIDLAWLKNFVATHQ